MVKIRNVADQFNAEWAKEILEKDNIPVMLKSLGTVSTHGGNFLQMGYGIDLYVPEELAEQAEQILKVHFGGS
ncbi:MAG: DUF2007 domain-containing protein [Ignavibacteriae bacterium]|nr:DUF2007 domain-containing protein [Ignavibacteriota bacterium]